MTQKRKKTGDGEVTVQAKVIDFVRIRELPMSTPATIFLDRGSRAQWYSPEWVEELESYISQIVKSDPVYPVLASLGGVPFLLHLPVVTRETEHYRRFGPGVGQRRVTGPALRLMPVDSGRSTATTIWAMLMGSPDQPLKASCQYLCSRGRVSADPNMDMDEPDCPTKPCPHCTKPE